MTATWCLLVGWWAGLPSGFGLVAVESSSSWFRVSFGLAEIVVRAGLGFVWAGLGLIVGRCPKPTATLQQLLN